MKIDNQFAAGKTFKVELTKAILVYESNDRNASSVAMLHKVANNGQLLPGEGVSLEAMQQVIYAMVDENARQPQVLSEHILALSMTSICWWHPASNRTMWIASKKPRLYSHPPLLFFATTDALRVFVLAENKRPKLETPLYHAPYMNISDRGIMCRGSARYPRFITPEGIKVFERAFFDTNFTHNSNPKNNNHPRGLSGLWALMRASKRSKHIKKCPTKYLHKAGVTLGDVIDGKL